MVMFLAVVVSFDDLHVVVQAGQAILEWFHALDASARLVRRQVALRLQNEEISRFSEIPSNLSRRPDDGVDGTDRGHVKGSAASAIKSAFVIDLGALPGNAFYKVSRCPTGAL
jgi:hypothetical protein